MRLFVMNGMPLEVNGKVAAFRRVNTGDDIRSNMHVGGSPEKARVTDEMLEVVSLVRPKLINDGMFLVGLDIVGDKLMEANVFSPGGLGSASLRGRLRGRRDRRPGAEDRDPGQLRPLVAQRGPGHVVTTSFLPTRRG